MPAAAAERRPLLESSIATQLAGSTPSSRAAARYTSGAGLPRSTSSEETVTRKASAKPASSSTRSITSRFDDDASPSGQRGGGARTGVDAPGSSGPRHSGGRAGQQRHLPPVALLHATHHVTADGLGVHMDAELVAQVR